jgi:hypothetical protein
MRAGSIEDQDRKLAIAGDQSESLGEIPGGHCEVSVTHHRISTVGESNAVSPSVSNGDFRAESFSSRELT